jgi:hypothetical protein
MNFAKRYSVQFLPQNLELADTALEGFGMEPLAGFGRDLDATEVGEIDAHLGAPADVGRAALLIATAAYRLNIEGPGVIAVIVVAGRVSAVGAVAILRSLQIAATHSPRYRGDCTMLENPVSCGARRALKMPPNMTDGAVLSADCACEQTNMDSATYHAVSSRPRTSSPHMSG